MSFRKVFMYIFDKITLIVIVLGLVFTGIGMFLSRDADEQYMVLQKCTNHATATILTVNTKERYSDEDRNMRSVTYTGKYSFSVDGVEYQGSYESYSAVYTDSTFDVVFDPSDPNICFYPDKVKDINLKHERFSVYYRIGTKLIIAGLCMVCVLVIYKIIDGSINRRKRQEHIRQGEERRRQELMK